MPVEDRAAFAASPGSLDEDGTFRIGSVGQAVDLVTGELIGGQIISLLVGRFVDDLMVWDVTQHVTITKGELSNNCQVSITVIFVQTE